MNSTKLNLLVLIFRELNKKLPEHYDRELLFRLLVRKIRTSDIKKIIEAYNRIKRM